MVNPPDDKNPGNKIPPVPGTTNNPVPGSDPNTRATQSANRGTGGKPAIGTPASTPGTSTSGTPTPRAPLSSNTVPGEPTPPPVPKKDTSVPTGATKAPTTTAPLGATGTTASTPPSRPAPATDTRRASDATPVASTTKVAGSAAAGAAATGTVKATPTPPSPTVKTERSTSLERPGATAPAPGKANQLNRPARPLERPSRPPEGRRPAGPPPQGARRPASAQGRPGRPDGRPPARRPRGEGQGRPVYRDNRPRRRMAPPPGGRNGRYVAPAARPARRGYVVPPAAAAPAGSMWGPLIFGILLLLGVLWYAIKHYAPMIDDDLTARTNSALQTAGYSESANVEIDGRNAVLNGSVATQADSEAAEELVANTIGVRFVDNQLSIGDTANAAAAERKQPTLTFLATDDGIKLSGTVSDQDYADQIENSAKEAYGEDKVSGSINVDPNSTNPGWWPAVQQIVPDLNNIDGGSFNVVNGALTLTGSSADEQTKTDIGAKAEELVNGQLTVNNRITVAAAQPAPAPAPEPAPLKPAFLNYFNNGEAIQLNGYLPTESAAQIASAFGNAGLPVQNNVDVNDAYAAPAWADNFAAATEAMQDIENAEVEVQTDSNVVIYGIATSEESKQAAADRVALIYPAFSNQITVSIPEPVAIVPSIQPFASVSDNGTTVKLAGLLPPEAAAAITSALESNGRTVDSTVTGDERVIAPEWADALTATLQSMTNGIENPQVMISAEGQLTISGLADNDGIRQQAANTSLDAFGNSVSLLNDIAVKGPDISELFARIDLAAIRFRSNSSELDADSISILEQVADALSQVPDAEVAISGHTDSTGNDDRNLFLSGERAERVRSFLQERGINGSRMTSQGFGSTQPIASNGTVTGRALNRRIEIALTNGE